LLERYLSFDYAQVIKINDPKYFEVRSQHVLVCGLGYYPVLAAKLHFDRLPPLLALHALNRVVRLSRRYRAFSAGPHSEQPSDCLQVSAFSIRRDLLCDASAME
jgi:hypothetical protein